MPLPGLALLGPAYIESSGKPFSALEPAFAETIVPRHRPRRRRRLIDELDVVEIKGDGVALTSKRPAEAGFDT